MRICCSPWEWVATLGLGAGLLAVFLLLPPLPQDPAYHNFADQRSLLGVPHFWNVVSNVPFLLVGLAGVGLLLCRRLVLDAETRPAFLCLFLGVALTGLGSAYYHLDPTNESLLWDRLPMTVGFMGLFAAVLGERTRPRVALLVLGPFLLVGGGSVLWWYFGEQHGNGNLYPYGVVQFYPLIIILLLVLFTPARYTRGADYLVGLSWYGLAKILELGDRWLFSLLGHMGGHPFKHVAAALGAFWVVRMLWLRRAIETPESR